MLVNGIGSSYSAAKGFSKQNSQLYSTTQTFGSEFSGKIDGKREDIVSFLNNDTEKKCQILSGMINKLADENKKNIAKTDSYENTNGSKNASRSAKIDYFYEQISIIKEAIAALENKKKALIENRNWHIASINSGM